MEKCQCKPGGKQCAKCIDRTKQAKKSVPSSVKYVLMHNNPDDHKCPIESLGVFDTVEEAEKVANDEDVMNDYGGTLEDGDFYIVKLPFNPSLKSFKQFHNI